jgi:hypothetical protein
VAVDQQIPVRIAVVDLEDAARSDVPAFFGTGK